MDDDKPAQDARIRDSFWPDRRPPDHDTRQAADALIAERRLMPFARGTNDCCMFAADAVLAMTGRDLAADWRGTYSDDRGALHVDGLGESGERAVFVVEVGKLALGRVRIFKNPNDDAGEQVGHRLGFADRFQHPRLQRRLAFGGGVGP